MVLIDIALRRYRQIKEFAYAYDVSNTLFTNQSLDVKEVSEAFFVDNIDCIEKMLLIKKKLFFLNSK